MSVLDIIICTLAISLCIAISVGAVFYYRLNKKYEEEVGMLKAKMHLLEERLFGLEERLFGLEERFVEHMAKYH